MKNEFLFLFAAQNDILLLTHYEIPILGSGARKSLSVDFLYSLNLIGMNLMKFIILHFRFIIYKFKDNAITNPQIFVELLFWKSTGDCYQISSREPPTKVMPNKWTPDEEAELKTLYDRFRESGNVVAEIMENIADKNRTKRHIVNKLVAMQCVGSRDELPREEKNSDKYRYPNIHIFYISLTI